MRYGEIKLTLIDLLDKNAELYPNETALVEINPQVTSAKKNDLARISSYVDRTGGSAEAGDNMA